MVGFEARYLTLVKLQLPVKLYSGMAAFEFVETYLRIENI